MSAVPQDATTAHGDAWEELGRLHHGTGGAWARLRGARLMASGLPSPAHNNADVTDPAAVDLGQVRAWYAGRGVPWGVRVPAGAPWDTGRHLFRKRLMGLGPDRFAAADRVAGLDVVDASTEDVDEVADLDVAAFGGTAAGSVAWLGPLVAAARARVLLARLGGRPVATAYVVRTDGEAGAAGYLGGLAVVADARRRGVAGDLASRLVAGAFEDGARLVHCHPGPGVATRVHERLGFEPAGAFDVYVDLD